MRPIRLNDIRPCRQASSGFTLLEIMVVIVVVGILVSLYVISIGSATDDGNNEHARRLEALLELALEEAGMQGREIGVHFYQHGYEFSSLVRVQDEEGATGWLWEPLDGDQMLGPRDLGEDIRIDLEIEGKEIVLEFERSEEYRPADNDDDEKEDEETEEGYRPQVFLFSSGDIDPPFRARIRQTFETEGTVVDVAATGKIELLTDEF